MPVAAEPFSEKLPSSPESERAVLGSVLISNRAFFRIDTTVDVDDFYQGRHRAIYRALAELVRAGKEADLISVKAALSPRQLELCGGGAYVSSLIDGIPDVANVETYAQAVADAAKRRRIAFEGHRITKLALASEDSPTDIARDAVHNLSLISVHEDRQAVSLHQIVSDEHERRDRWNGQPSPDRLTTGFAQLDARHVMRPTFIVCGAPYSHGKSAFLLNLAERIDRLNDKPGVALFTLEMTGAEVADRMVAIRSGVPHRDIRQWSYLSETQRFRIDKARESLRGRKIFVTRRIRKLAEIIAECRRLKVTTGLRVAMIDYIQLVRVEGIREKEQQMAHAAESLLELAVDQGIVVIAASQLNKDRLDRSSKRVWMGDLKYASAIGESARVGLLFQRPREDEKASAEIPPCRVDFQIEKNNEGTTGDYTMHFDPILQRFGEGNCAENDCRINRPTNEQARIGGNA